MKIFVYAAALSMCDARLVDERYLLYIKPKKKNIIISVRQKSVKEKTNATESLRKLPMH